MAVRPWENRFLDINLKDGVKILGSEDAEVTSETKTQPKSSGRKPLSAQKSNSDESSTNKSASTQDASNSVSVKLKSKQVPIEEANSRPAAGSRSRSNPKERVCLIGQDPKSLKRLSLPNNGTFSQKRLSLPIIVVDTDWSLFFSYTLT